MTRDPRIDPHEGDELLQRNGTLRLLVDGVTYRTVYYRIVDGQDGPLGAFRISMSDWRSLAEGQCEGAEEETP